MENEKCKKCGSKNIVMVEYAPGSPERYDGVSEIDCRVSFRGQVFDYKVFKLINFLFKYPQNNWDQVRDRCFLFLKI